MSSMELTNVEKDELIQQSEIFISDAPANVANYVSAQDQVTAMLHIKLKDKTDARKTFDAWLERIVKASRKWRSGAWAGRVVLRPGEDEPNPDYIIAFRFRNHEIMHMWLESKVRLDLKQELRDLDICEIVATDYQEGVVSFLPSGMSEVAWRHILSRDNIQHGEKAPGAKQTRSGPPPKWRSMLVIWVSLQLSVTPWNLVVAKPFAATGVPGAWRLVITLLAIVPVVKLILLPILDRLFHCFLTGKQCPNAEPFLSLKIGCGCCRPAPKPKDRNGERIASLEQHVQMSRRLQGTARRRLLERIERLELMAQSGNEKPELETIVDVGMDSALVQNETKQIHDGATHGKESEDQHQDQVPVDTAVTVIIAYQVRKGSFIQFEDWVQEIARIAATRSEGHRGALVIQAPKSSKTKTTHIVVFQYDTQEHLDAWTQSPYRQQLVARLQPLLEPRTLTEVKVHVYDSLADIAGHSAEERRNADIAPEQTSRGKAAPHGSYRPIRHDPQTWKIGLVISLALFLVIWFVGIPILHPWVVTWGIQDPTLFTIVNTAIGTFANVLALTYVLMPLLVPMSGRWLFAPWRESEWSIIAVVQRGFYCWDTIGQKMRQAHLAKQAR